jgi:hypothetical protein
VFPARPSTRRLGERQPRRHFVRAFGSLIEPPKRQDARRDSAKRFWGSEFPRDPPDRTAGRRWRGALGPIRHPSYPVRRWHAALGQPLRSAVPPQSEPPISCPSGGALSSGALATWRLIPQPAARAVASSSPSSLVSSHHAATRVHSHLPALAFVANSAARLPMSSLGASSAARLKWVAAFFLSLGQTCLAR